MIKIKHLLLAAAMAFTLCDVSLARETMPKPAGLAAQDRYALNYTSSCLS